MIRGLIHDAMSTISTSQAQRSVCERRRHQAPRAQQVSVRPAPGGRRTGAAVCEEDERRLVTQRQAAELVGCSKDTIIRARLAGRFAHAALEGHTWVVPVGDLIAAGLYDRNAGKSCPAPPSRRDPGDETSAVLLAESQAKVAGLEDLLARQDEELRFLRQLTADTLTRLGASV